MRQLSQTFKTSMVGKVCMIAFMLLAISWTGLNAKTVTGTVFDQNQEPLIGATVSVNGTKNAVVTDFNGKFSIEATDGQTLVVSYIGYVTKKVKVEGNNLKITLDTDDNGLEEVVVIGYGTARRGDLTGSIASVNGDMLREVPASDLTGALQGRIAGVDLTTTNSQPGASLQIRVRGQRSLTASNDPLIVLDGIPFMGSLSDIDPSSIKSMDILKDASSTAIYGSRGANGVIMITTYKGHMEQPAQVKYSAYMGFSTAVPYPMMTGDQLGALRDARGQYKDGPDEVRGTNTDWQDLFYRTGFQQNHSLNVSGGTKGGSYNVGLGFNDNKGVVPTQEFKRYSISANLDTKVGNWVRFGISTNTNYTQFNGGQLGLYGVLSASPLVNPYNDDGTIKRGYETAADQSWTTTRETIEAVEDTWLNRRYGFGSYNTAYAEISQPWIEGLTYRINVGANYRSSKTGSFTGTGVNSFNAENPNGASLNRDETTNWTVENILTYDNTFAEKHHLNITGMYSAEQTTWDQTTISGQSIPAEYFQYYNIGYAEQNLAVPTGGQGYTQSGLISWMGRVMYNYDEKYMIYAALRSDASSRLAKGHQWHTYPAVSVGWNMHKESFLSDVKWLDNLKLRIGYGETSNQSINPYSTLGGLSTRFYNFGDDFVKGYYVNSLPNTELGWEYSQTWNFGIDYSFLRGRIYGTFEYYTQKTKDLLLAVSLPSTSGVSSFMGNVGETENKGFEFSINGTILDNYNGWTWKAGLNFYSNKNKIVKLAVETDDENYIGDEANGWFIGHAIDAIYDYKKVGLWNESDPDYKYLDILEPGGNVGMIKVAYDRLERAADGTPTRAIGAADREIIDLEPDLMGGFNTSVSYKGFDLSIIGSFKIGGKIISTLYSGSGYLNMLTGRRGNVDVDYWTPTNTGAEFPNPAGILSGDNAKYAQTLGIMDAGYFKIRTITLGYNFKKNVLKTLGLKNLRVYATVQNPLTLSKYTSLSGQDPEPNSMSNNGQFHATTMGGHAIPVVGTNAPFTHSYIFGLDLTF